MALHNEFVKANTKEIIETNNDSDEILSDSVVRVPTNIISSIPIKKITIK